MSSRDWAVEKIRTLEGIVSAEPLGTDFIRIERRDDFLGEAHPPFVTGVVSVKRVTPSHINQLITQGQPFDFVTNIPAGAVWEGPAIAVAEGHNLGWGGFGELRSAFGQRHVRGFQKKEYSFVLQGLGQHSSVRNINRVHDRLLDIDRHGPLPPLRAVILYDYELTAERVREARASYGEFSAIVRTNPNGGATTAAAEAAGHIGAQIFQWGEFLSRLRKT